MLEQDAIEQLESIQYTFSGDNEVIHEKADKLLTLFLKSNGYTMLADRFREMAKKTPFWYA